MTDQPLTTELTLGKSEIPVHETWSVHDSSKIQAFMSCPRSYFYSYILGLNPSRGNHHLVFGSAWHAALEYLLLNGYTSETIQKAYLLFLDVWNREIDPFFEPDKSKNPDTALRGLISYANEWMWEDRPEDVLYTEVAGTVAISDTRLIHFKQDTIRKRPDSHHLAGHKHSLEHKTTGRLTEAWREQWHYLFQVGTYDHVLCTLYEPEEVEGVIINGSVFRTKDNEHLRIPVQFQNDMRLVWLWEANHWLNQIEWNFEQLAECSPSDKVMVAFPRNSASCSKYGCRFPGMCSLHANPLRRLGQTPIGYKQEFWDPREREQKDAKFVVEPAGPEKSIIKPKNNP